MKNEISSENSRRLAVIDSVFPWKQSGFRYWENVEIYKQRPDTLFFATNKYTDEFPTTVYPFSSFREIAKKEGITDVYCVFLNMVLSLLGVGNPYFVPGININDFLKENSINLHTTLYPGGGFHLTTPDQFLHIVSQNCKTIFTNTNEVLKVLPNSIYLPVVINTDFYACATKPSTNQIQLTFSAHLGIKKGFPLLAQVFNQLDEHFHLNIIGNWQNHLHLLTNKNYTFYGLLNPEMLKQVYEKSHIFIYSGSPLPDDFDGFPTTAAADAMATGCLLVSTNPHHDKLILDGGKDYIEILPNVSSIKDTLLWVKENFTKAMEIGKNGTTKIRKHFDSKAIVRAKLTHIFK